MHKYVSFKNQICLAQDVRLSGISSIALYGKGIFTTIAVYNSKPFLWDRHWQRLTENAEKVGVDLSGFSKESVKNSLAEIIGQNSVVNGRARLTFFVEASGGVWFFPSDNKTGLLITTADFRESPEIKLTVSPFQINSKSPLTNVKSCNYLENLLAFEEAHKRGFSEAVRLNEKGEIAGVCLANIFWIIDNEIFTPSLETGCLAGTTRNFLMQNFAVREVRSGLEVLEKADGIFLTSAGIGVAKVETFGNQCFTPTEVFDRIKEEFDKLVLADF